MFVTSALDKHAEHDGGLIHRRRRPVLQANEFQHHLFQMQSAIFGRFGTPAALPR
jgi:hypothetical protein